MRVVRVVLGIFSNMRIRGQRRHTGRRLLRWIWRRRRILRHWGIVCFPLFSDICYLARSFLRSHPSSAFSSVGHFLFFFPLTNPPHLIRSPRRPNGPIPCRQHASLHAETCWVNSNARHSITSHACFARTRTCRTTPNANVR